MFSDISIHLRSSPMVKKSLSLLCATVGAATLASTAQFKPKTEQVLLTLSLFSAMTSDMETSVWESQYQDPHLDKMAAEGQKYPVLCG